MKKRNKTTKRKSTNFFIKNKDITSVFVVTAAILAIPLVAMQFTNEVKWGLFDFIIIGTLIAGTGLLIVLTSRKIKNINHRVAIIIALLAALLLAWIQLAVGIIDTPFSGS